MAAGCGLSHQCPGEPALGARETAAGVHWTAAGENIGEGGPVADTGAAIAQLAVGLTQSMLDEKPPDDGHRLNILSSAFTHIGIAVYRDSSGTVWLTQDSPTEPGLRLVVPGGRGTRPCSAAARPRPLPSRSRPARPGRPGCR